MEEDKRPGKRPWGWWRYDCPRSWGFWYWDGTDIACVPSAQAAALLDMGVCDDAELAAIERGWAREDVLAHRRADNAVRVNGVVFHEALAAHRRLAGIPLDRPELDTADHREEAD